MACDVSLLAGIQFFDLLNEENRKALANVIDSTTLKDGETLFHAGEPGDALYIVRSGEIELYIKDTAGQRIVLNTARPGDFFGELALLDEGPRTATAAALADSELLVLGRDDLILLFQKNPDAALHMLASLGRMTRKADELLRTRVSRNLNVEEEETSTFGQRIADRVARFGGSWTFIILFGVFMLFWISTNAFRGAGAFDPFPYILLNLALSMLAAMQAPVIMMSQNRQSSKDRLKADLDYEVNLKAELEIAHLHEKTDRLYEALGDRLARLEKALKAPNR
ncbi:MAG: DUF1003 domain-containing protein [Candidatus Acidiferrales bacterium]